MKKNVLMVRLIFFLACLLGKDMGFSQDQAMPLTKEERDSVILNIGRYFDDHYVFPARGRALRESLDQMQAASVFDTFLDPMAFRRAVQSAVRSEINDQHIIFIYTGPQEDKNVSTASQHSVSDLKLEFEKRKVINFGLPELKVMEGNIGYLKISKFTPRELFGPVMRTASEYLRNVDGLILDLRSRGGGRSETVVLLLSYFLPPETHVFNWKNRYGEETERNWTLPFVDGQSFSGIPISILTSEKTFSGSEAFCYIMKHHGRATIIGEKTRGGAHTYKEMHPSQRFLILVPHQQAISAKTNQNWEAIGVTPDIAVPAEDALEVALKKMHSDLDIE